MKSEERRMKNQIAGLFILQLHKAMLLNQTDDRMPRKRRPFALQKVAFVALKHGLLEGKKPPFES